MIRGKRSGQIQLISEVTYDKLAKYMINHNLKSDNHLISYRDKCRHLMRIKAGSLTEQELIDLHKYWLDLSLEIDSEIRS